MAAWARIPTSFSSLPTVSSPSSSSSSLSRPLALLDLVDELWFYRSVIPLPAISLPCVSDFFVSSSSSSTSPPDSSTLIAQCMLDADYAPSPLAGFLSSSPSASPSRPYPDSEPTEYASWCFPVPREEADLKENGYSHYNKSGYFSMSDSDEDESYRRGYPRLHAGGEDEEAFHYYTAHSDWDDEDTHNGYNVPSDCEEEQPATEEEELQEEMSVYDPKLNAYLEPADDSLSGIYDVVAFLKDQHSEETEQVKENHSIIPPPGVLGAVLGVSAIPRFEVSAGKEQEGMKESLKLWAHAVASTLPWKAAAQARPLF